MSTENKPDFEKIAESIVSDYIYTWKAPQQLEEAITQALQSAYEAGQPKWAPIETAPKGRKVLVCGRNSLDKHRTMLARCVERFTEEDYSDSEGMDYCEEKDIYFIPEGWWEESEEGEECYPISITLTHYMPLPM